MIFVIVRFRSILKQILIQINLSTVQDRTQNRKTKTSNYKTENRTKCHLAAKHQSIGMLADSNLQQYLHTCMHTCIQTYRHTCMHTYIHSCIENWFGKGVACTCVSHSHFSYQSGRNYYIYSPLLESYRS